jgi:glycosyltransferase involved in cell wall biosynthesis
MRPQRRWVDGFRVERTLLRDAIRAHPADVIHAHWTYEFALAALAARSAPAVVSVHDWAPEVLRHHRDPYRLVRLVMQASVLARARHLTANSPYIAERIRRTYRRVATIIPNGIVMPSHALRSDMAPNVVIGSLNNGFSTLKNVGRLIDAFAEIRRSTPDATLRLAGVDFAPGGPAAHYAVATGSADGVEFLGPIPSQAVPEFMRGLSVLVHPSLEESFGMTLLEAIIEGTLVVAGQRSGAVPWVLGEGIAGELVDVSDAGAIASAVLRLTADQEFAARRRTEAFTHVQANFSLDHVLDLYEQVYRTALG